jgi:hypothetical protein
LQNETAIDLQVARFGGPKSIETFLERGVQRRPRL